MPGVPDGDVVGWSGLDCSEPINCPGNCGQTFGKLHPVPVKARVCDMPKCILGFELCELLIYFILFIYLFIFAINNNNQVMDDVILSLAVVCARIHSVATRASNKLVPEHLFATAKEFVNPMEHVSARLVGKALLARPNRELFSFCQNKISVPSFHFAMKSIAVQMHWRLYVRALYRRCVQVRPQLEWCPL
jgi:hypothetical protein